MKLVIGLVGEKGGGKETFGDLLKELLPNHSLTRVRFSDLLSQTLEMWSIPKTRANLQKIAVVMKDGFGPNSLPDALYEKINNLDSDIVILDGVRWDSDVKLLRNFKENVLVYVTTDLMTRYDRIKRRNEKEFEDATSFEQFMIEEKAENELLIAKIGETAEVRVNNHGSIDDLKNEVHKFIIQLKL
jgi:dephospho-CoA kinase